MNKQIFLLAGIFLVLLTGCAPFESSPTGVTSTVEMLPTATTSEALADSTETPAPAPTEILSGEPTSATSPEVSTTPCTGELTSRNQEGPYYTPGSPERASLLEAGMTGTQILIYGRVFDQACNPIPGAKVDFWQADADGVYDNAGYRLRGHVFTDENGYYQIETIAPGLYPGRPEHIHVKVFAPDGRELLTSQLYFPGSEGSADVLSAPDLLVQYLGLDVKGRQRVEFNFTVQN